MKTTKRRMFATIAAMAVLAGFSAVPMTTGFTAGAADTYTITIGDSGNVTTANHKFEAYQIFAGDISGGKLSNVQWGTGINSSGLVALLKADEDLNDIPEVADLADDASAAVVAEALGKIANESAAADALAKVLNTKLTDVKKESSGNTISELAPGYYFVKDAATSGTGAGDAKTKFILEVTANETVDIKTDAPTLTKQVWTADNAPTISVAAPTAIGSTWGDVNDVQIGDTVYYCIDSAVPDMSDYTTYQYVIRDRLSAGLTFKQIEKIVYVPDAGETVEVGGLTATQGDDGSTDGYTETFYISIADLKTTLTSANKGHLYTYYSATVDADFAVSNTVNAEQNNPNNAYLTYSNDPNDASSTGKTLEDEVYSWSFAYNGTKVDENDNPVAGAGFTLKKGDKDGTAINLIEITDQAQLHVNGVTELDGNTKYYRVALSGESGVTEFVTAEGKHKFMIIGLDAATDYTLVETTTPDGYNTCEPIGIRLDATYDSEGDELTALSENTVEIENKSGSTLPSTGGIGTTIFYVVGGAMVLGAGIFLIAKKRMKNKDEE